MNELRNEWASFIASKASWLSFWSLTFAEQDRTHDVTREEALQLWRRLVQRLNARLYGNHYTRLVGHSYFSYALAYEYQKRGMLHMHVLVDKRTDWELVNRLWRHWAGIVKVERVDDAEGACGYISKYVSKGGDVDMYIAKSCKEPAFKPLWYLGLGKGSG